MLCTHGGSFLVLSAYFCGSLALSCIPPDWHVRATLRLVCDVYIVAAPDMSFCLLAVPRERPRVGRNGEWCGRAVELPPLPSIIDQHAKRPPVMPAALLLLQR